jgi:ketosteroid isomerase-like protein
MTSRDMAKYAAMRPYFEVVAEGLKGLVDGTDFFDMHAEDVVVEYDPEKSVVVLEYTMHGTVVSTGAPYLNRFISVITVKDRKITHWRDYLDPLAVFAAFGTTPAPGTH